MKSLAGMLREKTPKQFDGTVSSDVAKMVRTFRSGMIVKVKKPVPSLLVANEPDFGYCEVPLGLLSQASDGGRSRQKSVRARPTNNAHISSRRHPR